MTSRLFAISAWLAAGHAALFGLFWLLLQVPESNVAMLAVSALLVVLLIVLAGWVEGVGLLAWRSDVRARQLPGRGAVAIPAVLAGFAVFGAIWWLTGWALDSWMSRRGEIDAWLMLHGGWTRTATLHSAVGWVTWFVRCVLGLSVALSLAAHWGQVLRSSTTHELSPASAGWLREAFSLRRVILITVVLLALFWAPWKAVGWRPGLIAPNWQELLFVGVKLGVIYLLGNIGCALVLRTAAPTAVPAPKV